MERNLNRLADEFYSAIEQNDLFALNNLYSADVEVWHNFTDRTQDKQQNLESLASLFKRISGLQFSVEARDLFPGGFVQRHVLHLKLMSGKVINVATCQIVYVAEEQINRVFEYVDSASLAALSETRSEEE